MKELSIEEKAKRYDEAVEYAHYLINERCKEGTDDSFHRADLQKMFPELKESEDEKIRKALLEMVHDTTGDSLWVDYNVHKEDAIAWLEKQGEQKPNKAEPKFKIGDWAVSKKVIQKPFCITDIKNPYYYLTDFNSFIKFGEEDNYRLWTIQDAKDGDVLCTYECGKPKIVFILKGMPKKPYVLGYHCYYNIMYPNLEIDSEKGCLAPNDEDIKPATKEQRDQLGKTMADAGYTFDFEKKELKKIELKPDETEKGIKGNEREIPICSAWNEEDEEILNLIIARLHSHLNVEAEEYDKDYYWLKSLKDRVLPQPKQKWSGEDERIIENLVSQLGNLYARKLIKEETKDKYVDWLKSLRPQSTWKPSDEQMQALSNAGNSFRPFEEGHKVLWSLYNDLKKLI